MNSKEVIKNWIKLFNRADTEKIGWHTPYRYHQSSSYQYTS